MKVSEPNLPSVLWRCWLGGRKGIRPVKNFEWWGAGVVICLERGADLHMAWPSWCHCHSLSLASVKSRLVLVLPFWYRLTWVVPEKGPLNVCVCVSEPQFLLLVWKYKTIDFHSCYDLHCIDYLTRFRGKPSRKDIPKYVMCYSPTLVFFVHIWHNSVPHPVDICSLVGLRQS